VLASNDRPGGDALGPGVRVKVRRDPAWAGPWPTEPLGTIEPFLGESFRLVVESSIPQASPRRDDGSLREFLVIFDEPQLDGDGGGPYEGAVIWETYLEATDDGPVSDTPTVQERAARGDALRAVLEHPERGERRA